MYITKNFFEKKTARNREIISSEEQKKIRNLTVGIAGLSVGSNILDALIRFGGPRQIKIADFDKIEVSNLNRINAKFKDVGREKVMVAKREALGTDPDLSIELFKKGLHRKNVYDFFLMAPKIDIFIDAMDDIKMKLVVREICKANKIPVIMATDVGHRVLLDIERHDTEKDVKLFGGRISSKKILSLNSKNKKEWLSVVHKIIGNINLDSRMKRSSRMIGKELKGMPQLITTSFAASALVSLAVFKIANNYKLKSGRYILDLEQVFKI